MLGGSLKIGESENVFNGGATSACRMDARRPRLDPARCIGLRSHPPESSDCGVDIWTGGEICWVEFREPEGWQDAFPTGAATSKLGIKWRLRLDWGLFYPPFLNGCADLLVARNISHGCLAHAATQPGRQFGKVVRGMVLNMLLPLACPPIIWAGSGLFISQKDEIRTTSGVPSDPSYLVDEVPPWGNPNSELWS